MKRKTSLVKGLVAILALSFCLVGCGKEEEIPEETVVEIPQEEEITVKDSNNKEVLDITTLTKDEFVDLTWEQIRDFTETYLPKYREIYGISEERVMEETDWLNLKEIMFYQLFNQVYSTYIRVGDVYSDVEIEEDTLGADWIYVTPTKEYLYSLTKEDFAIYLNNFYEYHDMSLIKTTETGEEVAFDFQDMFAEFTEEEFEEVRNQFVEEMKETIDITESSEK